MANIKFTQLPNQGLPTDSTVIPTVASGTNFTVTGANLKSYVNSAAGNITAATVSATGNVTGAYILGDGSQLTNITSTYGNANVAVYLPVNSANIQGNFISAIGNISANYVLGNGSQLTGLPATYTNSNVVNLLAAFGSNTVSTTGNITASNFVGSGAALTVIPGANITGTISTIGNITAAYVSGNISGATGGYNDSNVQTVLQNYTGSFTAGTVSTTGNITAPYFVGNGSALTGITASLGGTMSSNIAGAGYSITGINTLSASGNVTGANITGTHYGSGAALTGIPTSILAGAGISVSASTGTVTITNNNPTPYGNTNVAAYLPTYSGNLAGGNLAVTSAVTAASVSTTGTITGTHAGNGAGLSNIVTSIVAGSGISINQSTGAVTVTATGGSSSGKIASSLSGGINGSSTETISASVLIPANTFTTGDVVEIYAQWVNDSGAATQRYGNIYINSSNSIPSSSLQIFGGIAGSSAGTYSKIWQRFEIAASNQTRTYIGPGSTSQMTNAGVYAGLGSTSAIYTVNVNWTVNQYIIFTCRSVSNSPTDGMSIAGYQIYKG